jgi:hypothetical protein
MKKFYLDLDRDDATKILRDSLRVISPTANRVISETDCYGNIEEANNRTSFTIGLGPTGYTRAVGEIVCSGDKESLLYYEFKGFFWSFLVKYVVNQHIKKLFQNHIKQR